MFTLIDRFFIYNNNIHGIYFNFYSIVVNFKYKMFFEIKNLT